MLEKLNLLLWGYGTIALIIITGIFFSVRIGFLQLRLGKILKATLFSKRKTNSGEAGKKANPTVHGISPFQALSTALSASMGTGNIVGVAAAIAVGGPGAVFWMWVSAFFGMGTAYAENYLGVLYKNKLRRKSFISGKHTAATITTAADDKLSTETAAKAAARSSGAMLYLEHGLGSKPLAVIFAIAAVFASFGVGNMTQSNAMSGAVTAVFPGGMGAKILIGIVTAIIAGAVIMGGSKRIAAAAEKIIPIVSLFYILGAVAVITLNYYNIPEAMGSILTGAFGLSAASGGVTGALIKRAVTVGLQRGIFSNEAGMGSSVFAHTETDCKDGAVMGMWAILEVFIDTVVCCTLTALVLLLTHTDVAGTQGGTLSAVSTAFGAGLGRFAGLFISISTVIFAFATILGWSFYGEKAVLYLSGRKSAQNLYRFVYIMLIAVGAVTSAAFVWELSDIFNAVMLIPNLLGIVFLHKEVKKPGD